MKKEVEVSVAAVMEQLKAVGADQNAQHAVLSKCPEEFIKEMAEVVNMKLASFFWRVPVKGQKKYFLDKLTQVYTEQLPTEVLKHDRDVRLGWLAARSVAGKYSAEWQEYLR